LKSQVDKYNNHSIQYQGWVSATAKSIFATAKSIFARTVETGRNHGKNRQKLAVSLVHKTGYKYSGVITMHHQIINVTYKLNSTMFIAHD